jgi:hypothetical protein
MHNMVLDVNDPNNVSSFDRILCISFIFTLNFKNSFKKISFMKLQNKVSVRLKLSLMLRL